MQTTFGYAPIEGALGRGDTPTELVDGEEGCRAFYTYGPPTGGSFKWRTVPAGQKVCVPLLPYCSIGKDAENAIGHAVQLGFQAALDALRTAGVPPLRLHLSIGTPVEELDRHLSDGSGELVDCYRYWIGVCVFVR